MKRLLTVLAGIALAFGTLQAKESHRVDHWKATVAALEKAGHAKDSEVVRWAHKNLERSEYYAAHPHEKKKKHHKAGLAKTEDKKKESWFERAKEAVVGKTTKAEAATKKAKDHVATKAHELKTRVHKKAEALKEEHKKRNAKKASETKSEE